MAIIFSRWKSPRMTLLYESTLSTTRLGIDAGHRFTHPLFHARRIARSPDHNVVKVMRPSIAVSLKGRIVVVCRDWVSDTKNMGPMGSL